MCMVCDLFTSVNHAGLSILSKVRVTMPPTGILIQAAHYRTLCEIKYWHPKQLMNLLGAKEKSIPNDFAISKKQNVDINNSSRFRGLLIQDILQIVELLNTHAVNLPICTLFRLFSQVVSDVWFKKKNTQKNISPQNFLWDFFHECYKGLNNTKQKSVAQMCAIKYSKSERKRLNPKSPIHYEKKIGLQINITNEWNAFFLKDKAWCLSECFPAFYSDWI